MQEQPKDEQERRKREQQEAQERADRERQEWENDLAMMMLAVVCASSC
jgi:hypothetical protein